MRRTKIKELARKEYNTLKPDRLKQLWFLNVRRTIFIALFIRGRSGQYADQDVDRRVFFFTLGFRTIDSKFITFHRENPTGTQDYHSSGTGLIWLKDDRILSIA